MDINKQFPQPYVSNIIQISISIKFSLQVAVISFDYEVEIKGMLLDARWTTEHALLFVIFIKTMGGAKGNTKM